MGWDQSTVEQPHKLFTEWFCSHVMPSILPITQLSVVFSLTQVVLSAALQEI